MTKNSRAIIVQEYEGKKCIVSIKRTKYKENGEYIYYTFPGGTVENDESFEETLHREIDEELGIKVNIVKLLKNLYCQELDKDENFYICEYISGVIGTGNGPEFTNVDVEKYGKYEIVYIPIEEIDKYNLLPIEITSLVKELYK